MEKEKVWEKEKIREIFAINIYNKTGLKKKEDKKENCA